MAVTLPELRPATVDECRAAFTATWDYPLGDGRVLRLKTFPLRRLIELGLVPMPVVAIFQAQFSSGDAAAVHSDEAKAATLTMADCYLVAAAIEPPVVLGAGTAEALGTDEIPADVKIGVINAGVTQRYRFDQTPIFRS